MNAARSAEPRGYDQPDGLLGPYALLVALYNGLFAAFVAWAVRSGRPPRSPLSKGDVALLALATHKASRVLTKDSVTSPLRAPFTHFEEPTADGEVREEPRGRGLRHAIGELLVCPFCMDQWVATTFACGLVALPSWTRLVAAVFAIRALADFLHLADRMARKQAGS